MSEYNGWTNYETWCVNLWLDNDQGTQKMLQEMAQECWNESAPGKPNQYMDHEANARYALQQRIREFIDEQAEEWMPDQSSMFADLINSSLGAVNYYEIAQSLLDEVEKGEEEIEEETEEVIK